MVDSHHIDQRKHQRSDFAYPVEIKIFSIRNKATEFDAYIKNISKGGACIQFEDKYGRVDFEELADAKIKITLFMPHGEKVILLSVVRRSEKDVPEQFFIKLGLQFENVEEWQMEAIKKLISLENKDQNMMWNLWEHFERQL